MFSCFCRDNKNFQVPELYIFLVIIYHSNTNLYLFCNLKIVFQKLLFQRRLDYPPLFRTYLIESSALWAIESNLLNWTAKFFF